MSLQKPAEIQAYYRDGEVVARYLERRTAQPLNGTLHDAQVRFLRQVVAERAPQRVVEIAPGPARLTSELSIPGVGLAVEFSDGMLAIARQRVADTRWRFVRGDAFHLPVTDGCADLVYAFRFVRRFQPAQRQQLYAGIRRILRPGGALVLDAQNRAIALPHREAKGLDRYPVYDALYDRDELVAELGSAGFRVTRVASVMKHFRIQQQLNRLRLVGLDALARGLIRALEMIPSNNPSTWIVLSEVA